MSTTMSADPLHLPPAPKPAPFECTSCHDGAHRDELTPLGDHLVCSRCYFTRGCKSCHAELATKADEDGTFCARCYADWLSRNPDELPELRPLLEQTAEGREVLAQVCVGYERATAELEESRRQVAVGMRNLARESRAQWYRELAGQVREEA